MPAISTIGDRIKAVRVRAGLPQERFATTLGYSRRALINWEQGIAEPPIGILGELRRLYDVDPEWIVTGEDTLPRQSCRQVDWGRFDRIERDVDAACTQVGMDLEPQVLAQLIRGLFDDDPSADEANRKRLRVMLRAIAAGKST